jgi:multiple antibiotic resistance protein
MLDLPEYLQLFVALLAITNPLGKIPVFNAMAAHHPAAVKHRLALVAAASVVAILLVSFFVGEIVLHSLGITIPAFRIAGGILLLLSALSMMSGADAAPAPGAAGAGAGDVIHLAVVPLAIPLLAGPGAISTVIVYAHREGSIHHASLVAAAVVTVGVVILVILRLAPLLAAVLKRTGMNVATRITGLLIAATAVEFIVDGLAQLFPGLLK